VSYTIHFDKETQILTGILSGVITNKVLIQYTRDTEKICRKMNPVKILSDYRDASFDFSVVDLYYLPEKHNRLLKSLGTDIYGLKRAILIDPKDEKMGHFFENVANNRGQRVKVFCDESEAIDWLTQ